MTRRQVPFIRFSAEDIGNDEMGAMKKINRRNLTTFLWLAIGALLGSGVHADQSYPVKLIRMVVPFSAGGGTDVMARLVAQEMASTLKQPIVIDNKSGAGGALGADAVAKSAPDGYTILMATASTHAINPNLYARLPYDPVESFTPIGLIARVPGIVVVNLKSSIRTLRDLVLEMKKRAGRITYGSQGMGGFSHLMGEMLNSQAGAHSLHVPYRGGALAVQDLLAGNVDVVYDTLPAVLPHIQSGVLRALAITPDSSQRHGTPSSGLRVFRDRWWIA